MDDGKANALSAEMLAEMGAALTRAEEEASAVVVAGRSDRFSGGFDLKVMTSSPEAAQELVSRGAELLMRIYGSPLPVVAACTGHAIAAGALLLLVSDLRIGAAGEYRIGLNEVAIGLPLPLLGTELARDRIPTAELARATLRAHLYAPDEAVRAGFLDEAVAAAQVLVRAREEADRLGGFARVAFHGTKQRLRKKTIQHVLSTLEDDMRAMRFEAMRARRVSSARP
jgi:enoyl-CoA hydratase